MQIYVNQILEEKTFDKFLIKFSCEYGAGIALWKGDRPSIKNEYSVEIEINEILTWGKEVVVNDEEIAVKFNNGDFYIAGLLESVDDDGYSVIRLGQSIIAVETQGIPFPCGIYVKAKVTEAVFYKVEY